MPKDDAKPEPPEKPAPPDMNLSRREEIIPGEPTRAEGKRIENRLRNPKRRD